MNRGDVETFLRRHVGGDVAAVDHLRDGEWSSAYAYRHADADYVIRFSASEGDFGKDRLAARHTSPELPIPRIVDEGRAFDGHFAISERAFGSYLDELDEREMRAVLPSLFAALDAARQVEVPTDGGYGYWNASETAPYPTWSAALLAVANGPAPVDRISGWRERLDSSPTGSGPFDEAYRCLQGLADYGPDARHLIHSDLLDFNVLVSGDRVTAVLDWGNSMYGDFLYDVAWLCFWCPWYPQWSAIDFKQEAVRYYESAGVEVPDLEERLRCCQLHIGLDGQAYNAFKGRWTELDRVAERTLSVARQGDE